MLYTLVIYLVSCLSSQLEPECPPGTLFTAASSGAGAGQALDWRLGMEGWCQFPRRERAAGEDAQAGTSWGHAKVSNFFLRSQQRAAKGVCSGMTDRILILRPSSGFEVRSEAARRDGGSEGRLPGFSRTPGGQACRERCLELAAGEEGELWKRIAGKFLTALGCRAAGIRLPGQPEG